MALCDVCNMCPVDGYYLIRTVTDANGDIHYQAYQFDERPDDNHLNTAFEQMDRLLPHD